MLNIQLKIAGKTEYRGLHSFVEYRTDYRPVGPNEEHHIQLFNRELNIDLDG